MYAILGSGKTTENVFVSLVNEYWGIRRIRTKTYLNKRHTYNAKNNTNGFYGGLRSLNLVYSWDGIDTD